MDEYESLSHTKWECKYHVVFIPKCSEAACGVQWRRSIGIRTIQPKRGLVEVSSRDGLRQR
jgi:hypothetical protein